MKALYDLPGHWLEVSHTDDIEPLLSAFPLLDARGREELQRAVRAGVTGDESDSARWFVAIDSGSTVFGAVLRASRPEPVWRGISQGFDEQIEAVAQAVRELDSEVSVASTRVEQTGIVRVIRGNGSHPDLRVVVSYVVLDEGSDDILSLAFTSPHFSGPEIVQPFDLVAASVRWIVE